MLKIIRRCLETHFRYCLKTSMETICKWSRLIKRAKALTAVTTAKIDNFTRFINDRAIANKHNLTPPIKHLGTLHIQAYYKTNNLKLLKYITETVRHFSFAAYAWKRIPVANVSSNSERRHAIKCDAWLKVLRKHFNEQKVNNSIANTTIACELAQWA